MAMSWTHIEQVITNIRADTSSLCCRRSITFAEYRSDHHDDSWESDEAPWLTQLSNDHSVCPDLQCLPISIVRLVPYSGEDDVDVNRRSKR